MRRQLLCILGLLLCATAARAQGTDAMLDTLQHRAFQYFWSETNGYGLIKDRSTPGSVCSIAATGFGLSSICVGVDHGWATRTDAAGRVLATLNTFWTGPQGPGDGYIGYHGLYYHFLDMTLATRTWSSELSTIDTALLFAGILDCKMYFNNPTDPTELQIRALADSIYQRADWNFMRNGNPGILMGWQPSGGFSGYGQWIGYNEAMILYILALGSPTHSVPASAWTTWTSGYNWHTYFTYPYVTFAPLFGHQYSHCWVDFRNIQDAYMAGKGIDYFENSRRASLVQQAYCKLNPLLWAGYSDSLWGITASDDPVSGYAAHGVPPTQSENGTISPTAAVSSIAFAPTAAIPATRHMMNDYPGLWGAYGLKDAFNLSRGWYDTDFLGIDVGPEVLMIENYRTGAVWTRFMKNVEIRQGLIKAGFSGVTGVGRPPGSVTAIHSLYQNSPNPFRGTTQIRYALGRDTHVRLALYDVTGRLVRSLVDAPQAAGEHAVTLDGRSLDSGVYQYRLEAGGAPLVKKCIVVR